MHRASPSSLDPQPAASSPPSPTPPAADRRRSRAERRSSQRRAVSVAVRQEVVATPALSGELHLAQSSDLGLGGMRVWRRAGSDEPELPLSTPLRLAFQLPDDGQLLEVAGEVVFDRQTANTENGSGQSYRATGVRFSAVPDEVLTRLKSFLEE